MSPIQYYFFLRKIHKYSPRNAANSVLMNYCPNKADYRMRAIRIAQLLGKIDKRS